MNVEEASRTTGIPPFELDRAIERVLAAPEFAWRLPRDRAQLPADAEGSLIGRFFAQLGRWLEQALRFAWKWIEKVIEWLRDRLEFGGQADPEYWQLEPQLLLFAVLAGAAAALTILLLRMAGKRRLAAAVAARPIESVPDITRENVVADQLPVDRWMDMARDFMSRGEVRFAVRAMFLAALAHLAARRWITIAAYKSNREYGMELRRRARDRVSLLNAFGANVLLFEEVWYGMHRLSHERLACFNTNQEIILHDGKARD